MEGEFEGSRFVGVHSAIRCSGLIQKTMRLNSYTYLGIYTVGACCITNRWKRSLCREYEQQARYSIYNIET